ncbi:unnamed protein product, partial [Meganyctiphanes norvegica]
MSSQKSLLERLVSSSVTIANAAGEIICDVMKKGDLGIVQKEHLKDLQTEADREAQLCIVSSLNKYFPNITIIGEEDETVGSTGGKIVDISRDTPVNITVPDNYCNINEKEVVVWVDPLDGTSEYTQGLLDHVTVLIGIAVNGKAIAGVIHQPYFNYKNPGNKLGRTIWGVVGGVVGGMEIKSPPVDRYIVATTRSHASSTVNEAISSVSPDEVLRVGGSGHKVMLLLEGLAHSYVFASPGTKKWDTCAPQAILEAAGGSLTDICGEILPYAASAPHRNSKGVLATAAGQDHLALAAKIPQQVKDNLIP